MRSQWILGVAALATLGGSGVARGQGHFNPLVDLLQQKKPEFGVYIPANRGGRGGRGGAPAPDAPPPPPAKTPAQLVQEAFSFTRGDFLFDGSMEGNFDAAYPVFSEFMKAMADAGMVEKSPTPHLKHPITVKTHEIAPDVKLATERIGKQLNLGVSGVVFVGVESADEVKAGLAAMRFKSQGGTRSDDVGDAPARWGMTEKEYKEKADLAGLNPKGELVNWTIVESKEGLKHVREIAAVKGISVLFPGAGTLRGVFAMRDSAGQPIRDENGRPKTDTDAWEASIQQVLAACKEFKVPCGYPATENDIETRMKQGFSVFIINWGDAGFRAVDIGRKVSGRDTP